MKQYIHTSRYILTVGGESSLLTYATPTASRGIAGFPRVKTPPEKFDFIIYKTI